MAKTPYTLQFCVEDKLRNLSRMLACLDRVGKDLYLEAANGQVSLRTLNAAQSAFVKFHLRPDFFTEFVLEPDASLSIRLYMKNVVPIFKSVQGVSKVWVQIASGADENYLRVQKESTNGLRKKFDLAFEEVAMINAVYSHDACPLSVTADPITFLSCLSNFPPSLAEVTLVAGADTLTLRNDPESLGLDYQKGVGIRTNMSIAAAKLHSYDVGTGAHLPRDGVAVTFSLREFKALLNLAKELEHRIRLRIEAAGQPILLSSEARDAQLPPSFTVESVLATVVETVNLDEEMDFFGDDAEANGYGAGGYEEPPSGYSQHASTAPSQPHDYGAQPQPAYAQPLPAHAQQPSPYPQQPPNYAPQPAAYTPQPSPYAQYMQQLHAQPPMHGQPPQHGQSQPWSHPPDHAQGTSQRPGGAARPRPQQPHEQPATTQSHRWQAQQPDAPHARSTVSHSGRTDCATSGFAAGDRGSAGQPSVHTSVQQHDSIYSFAGTAPNGAATPHQPAAPYAGPALPPSGQRASGQSAAHAQHRQKQYEQQQHGRSPFEQEQERAQCPQQEAPPGQASERRRDAVLQEPLRERPGRAEPAKSWRPGAYHGDPDGPQPPAGDSDTEEEEDAVPGTPPNEHRHGYSNGGNGSGGTEHDASAPSRKRPCVASEYVFG